MRTFFGKSWRALWEVPAATLPDMLYHSVLLVRARVLFGVFDSLL